MTRVNQCLASVVGSIAGLALLTASATAASLSISPIRIDVVEPGNSSNVTVTNSGATPVNVQVRIFRWAAKDGQDDYAETDDVVVTPPITTVGPGAKFTTRTIRQADAPIQGEEAYRLVVDEIPDANRARNLGVTVAVRYVVPVFFISAEATQPQVSWSIQKPRGGKPLLVATNNGDKHLRLSALRIGKVTLAAGLAGYVLGHGSHAWPLPTNAGVGPITADSDAGAVNAVLAP
jgi:fimbrial chaperone protein